MGTEFGFGERLARLRAAKGMTQADLGKGLNTGGEDASKSVVYGWEKDQHYPRVDQLRMICDRLGCSADYLVYGVAENTPFSREVMARAAALEPEGVTRLENVMRAHLGLLPINAPARDDSQTQQQTDTSPSDKTVEPVKKNRVFSTQVDLGGSRASGEVGRVQKPRGRRGT